MAATITENTFLMHGSTKLVDIKEFPDLGKAPDTIDVTTLSNHAKVYINDLQDPGALEFTANYDKDDFEACKALEGKSESYAVWFGVGEGGEPDGHLGKFTFTGELSVWAKGAGVSAAREMGISIAPSTEITFA